MVICVTNNGGVVCSVSVRCGCRHVVMWRVAMRRVVAGVL